ncbi:hypothetical protein YC2023_061826 [Brassica napus]
MLCLSSPVTPTSSKTSSSPPTANSRFPEAGTASFASGVSPQASRLADSSDTPKTSSLWPSRSTTLRSTLAGHTGYASTVAVSPDDSLCASGGKDGGIKIWDLESKNVVEDLKVDLKAEAEKSDGSGTAATERKGTVARG